MTNAWLEGGCHCRRVRLRVRVPNGEREALDCNCSICTKKGFLHLIVGKDDFELLSGGADLTTYTFNTGVAKHTFCRHCGIHAFYTPRSHPDGIDVNIRCLDGDAWRTFRIVHFDGARWEESAAVAFSGDERMPAPGRASYEQACACDRAGKEEEAVPLYEKALALGLAPRDRAEAMLGLGSSLRNVDRVADSVTLLSRAVSELPDHAALSAFLALAHYSAGDHARAFRRLMTLVIEHAPVGRYARALRQYNTGDGQK